MEYMPVMDAQSKEPLYQQLYKQLSRRIASGEIPSGTKMPSIRQLMKASGVGKIRLRLPISNYSQKATS